MPKEYIFSHPEKKLSKLQTANFEKWIKRRSKGEPIAYITGKKEFFGLEFFVDKNVLIPRPETELLVEEVIEQLLTTNYSLPTTVIDVGTGSGNIIISILKKLPGKIRNKINFFAVDISKDALRVAKKNARQHKVDKKINFIQSNLLEYFLKSKNKNYKNIFIVANLPYVSPDLYQKNKNNLAFEPKGALISQQKGMTHYERLIKEIGRLQKKFHMLHVTFCMEFSPEQKTEISRITRKILPESKTEFLKDLAGKWRAAMIGVGK